MTEAVNLEGLFCLRSYCRGKGKSGIAFDQMLVEYSGHSWWCA